MYTNFPATCTPAAAPPSATARGEGSAGCARHPSASAPGCASPGCWFLGLDRAELRPRESPGPRSGTPARPRAGRRPAVLGASAQLPPRITRYRPSAARRIFPRRLRVVPRVEPVLTPFPHVPVHVVQAPRDSASSHRPAACDCRCCRKPTVFAQSLRVVPEAVFRRCTRSTRIFPFGFAWASDLRPTRRTHAPRPNSRRPPVARAG